MYSVNKTTLKCVSVKFSKNCDKGKLKVARKRNIIYRWTKMRMRADIYSEQMQPR